MAEKPVEPNEEIPAFQISEKRVDDSWKEEVRREREKAAQAAASAPAAVREEAPAAASPDPGARAKPAGEPPREKRNAGTAEQQQSKLFLQFLAGLVQQTLIQVGDIANPYSGQREVDLQGARYTIELLNTIQVKTKNNLTEEEETTLTSSISELKMRFVEIANEVQRQMQAEAQKAARGPARPGPGGTIPGPGFGKRR